MKNKYLSGIFLLAFCLAGCTSVPNEEEQTGIRFVDLKEVKVNDAFWSPRLKQWSTVTTNDVLDKFEGKHLHDHQEQHLNNAFVNFDDVAEGKKNTGHHAGFPWFDGLVYETIRGIADLISQHPDKVLEARIDGYIDRIYAAQQVDPEGYINTYTDLVEPDHRWGDNGGFLRWQHDVYNAGMLIEAGIHYYQATGKTKLLEVSTIFANHMCGLMGPSPRRNIVPSHSGPEEPMIKLYWLYKHHPELKTQMNVPVNEDSYWDLATFWIENRGNHCGFPLWLSWGNSAAEQWIKDVKYKEYGPDARPTWGDYAQDSISVFAQKTIEGHAVRATLLATGIATAALENQSPKYMQSAKDLWDNMVGKRMFVTGGVGAVHHDEKFGPDYFLPTDAYLETCAAVGVGFFSQRMNELTGDGKYMDEFERALYNNILTGISLSGDKYTYQNPLNSHNHSRWEWHECPCCPPMFLKLVSAFPGYIYSFDNNNIFVNLFVGSETNIPLSKNNPVQVKQETRYPWDGSVIISVNPETAENFSLQIRIPGWAQGVENPYDLYTSNLKQRASLKVNGEALSVNPVNGYIEINRQWKKGDRIELLLPMQPRIIQANNAVKQLDKLVAIASGPIIYGVEGCDNKILEDMILDINTPLDISYESAVLDGVNVIRSKDDEQITAVPYYALGNRKEGSGYKVWIPKK